MIAIFDEDGGGDVDFQEFVSGLSAFSSKGNKEEKLRFAFKVYDIDRDDGWQQLEGSTTSANRR